MLEILNRPKQGEDYGITKYRWTCDDGTHIEFLLTEIDREDIPEKVRNYIKSQLRQ